MKNKKHIDKLFKDRFKDFEVSPSPEVWSKYTGFFRIEEEEPQNNSSFLEGWGCGRSVGIIIYYWKFNI